MYILLLFSTNLLNCMCMHKGDILLYESDIRRKKTRLTERSIQGL